MTDHVIAPQARLIAGMARVDVTPKVGTYHRMWGAATHDRSTGVHRPLTATALWLQPRSVPPADSGQQDHASLVFLAVDHCLFDRDEYDRLRAAVGTATGLSPEQVHLCLSHTHGAGLMSRGRAALPGGDLIGPYLDNLAEKLASCARDARRRAKPANIVAGAGRCDLARHRDYLDPATKQFVCGFNPRGAADDTVMVARVVADDAALIGTIVNYACHPTTLAWENTLISPDYIGALQETVEGATGGAPCFFLQGASGELGPREGFVGDPRVADRNGRQLAHAALTAFEALPPPETKFAYSGAVVSGATLGTWRHEPLDARERSAREVWRVSAAEVTLAYRPDLPTMEESQQELTKWQTAEAAAKLANDTAKQEESRARAERMTRQINRLKQLPPGKTFTYRVSLARTGDVLWVLAPGELYQFFQTELRRRFPHQAVFVSTLTDDWQPGYLPDEATYGKGIYQEQIAIVAAGSLEKAVAETATQMETLRDALPRPS